MPKRSKTNVEFTRNLKIRLNYVTGSAPMGSELRELIPTNRRSVKVIRGLEEVELTTGDNIAPNVLFQEGDQIEVSTRCRDGLYKRGWASEVSSLKPAKSASEPDKLKFTTLGGDDSSDD